MFASVIICAITFIIGFGSIERALVEIDTFILALPVIVPLIVAPLATSQLTSVLAVASALIDDLETAHTELEREVAQRKAAQNELERLANRDPLTGLLNRRGFFRALQRLGADELDALLLAAVDIDEFKSVNDSYGHALGDHVLCAVGAALELAAGSGAIVARMGGDEFVAALINRQSGVDDVRSALSAISVASPAHGSLEIHCSVGSSTHLADKSVDATLAEADSALYRDKERRQEVDQTRSSANCNRSVG